MKKLSSKNHEKLKTLVFRQLGKTTELFGKPAHATLPFDGEPKAKKNVRLFNWFTMSKQKREDRFYNKLADIEEENVLGKYIVNQSNEDGMFEPELREGVIPFGYIVNDWADKNDWEVEGLLMLDVQKSPPKVLIARVDGTVDGREPFKVVRFETLKISQGNIKAS